LGLYLFCLFIIIGGIFFLIKGLRYTKNEQELDKHSKYVIAGNGWFDEFLRIVLPYMPIWVIKLVYIIIGLFIIILGIYIIFGG